MSRFLSRWGVRMTAGLAVCGAGFGVANLGHAAAHADPVSSVALNAVGSDALQDVVDAYAGFDAGTYYTPLSTGGTSTALPTTLNSWDAVPLGGSAAAPGCITTTYGGPSFDRPNGGSAGITALIDAQGSTGWKGTASCTGTATVITNQVQLARSPAGPSTTGTNLTFIPFARDALSLAVFDNNTGVLNGHITQALLQSWYATPATPASLTVGGTTYSINLCLPQSGSGIRKQWYKQVIGVSDPGTSSGCDSLEQNGGDSFLSSAQASFAGNGSFSVIPFSTASWISQSNQKAVDRSGTGRSGGVYLSTLDISGTQTAPDQTSGSTLVPNTTYYQSTAYGINDYFVAPTSKVTGFGASASYKALLVGGTSAICSASSQSTAVAFGFDTLTASEGTCGSTTTTGNS